MMEAAAPYLARRVKAEDATIRRALRILETRLREPGAALSSPAAVRPSAASTSRVSSCSDCSM